jgi:hypothetical protein
MRDEQFAKVAVMREPYRKAQELMSRQLSEYVDRVASGALPPRSHTHDPATSRAAESRSSRARGPQMRAVLALVLTHDGRTATELAAYVCDGFASERYERRQQIRRRLSDLKLLGQVRQAGRRDGEVTWEVVR